MGSVSDMMVVALAVVSCRLLVWGYSLHILLFDQARHQLCDMLSREGAVHDRLIGKLFRHSGLHYQWWDAAE